MGQTNHLFIAALLWDVGDVSGKVTDRYNTTTQPSGRGISGPYQAITSGSSTMVDHLCPVLCPEFRE